MCFFLKSHFSINSTLSRTMAPSGLEAVALLTFHPSQSSPPAPRRSGSCSKADDGVGVPHQGNAWKTSIPFRISYHRSPSPQGYGCDSGETKEKFLNSSWLIIGRCPSSIGVKTGSSFMKSGSKLLTSSRDLIRGLKGGSTWRWFSWAQSISLKKGCLKMACSPP